MTLKHLKTLRTEAEKLQLSFWRQNDMQNTQKAARVKSELDAWIATYPNQPPVRTNKCYGTSCKFIERIYNS